jgi:hypothetical protein
MPTPFSASEGGKGASWRSVVEQPCYAWTFAWTGSRSVGAWLFDIDRKSQFALASSVEHD